MWIDLGDWKLFIVLSPYSQSSIGICDKNKKHKEQKRNSHTIAGEHNVDLHIVYKVYWHRAKFKWIVAGNYNPKQKRKHIKSDYEDHLSDNCLLTQKPWSVMKINLLRLKQNKNKNKNKLLIIILMEWFHMTVTVNMYFNW